MHPPGHHVFCAVVLLTAMMSGCASTPTESLNAADWQALNALPTHDPVPPAVLIGPYHAPILDGGEMWIWSEPCLIKIDPVTGREILRSEKLSAGRYAVGGSAIWMVPINIFSKQVVRKIDAQTGKVVAQIPLNAWRVAADKTSVWVADRKHDALVRIDPESNAVLARIPVGPEVNELAVGEGGVWVLRSDAGYLTRVDPGTNQVVAQIPLPSKTCFCITTGEGGVWLGASDMDSLLRIDPVTNRAAKIPVGSNPLCVAAGGGSVWTATAGTLEGMQFTRLLVRVDPHSNQAVERLMVHDVFQPTSMFLSPLAADERGLWVVLTHHIGAKLWYLRR